VYYTLYNIDIFDCVVSDLSRYTEYGNVVIADDLNSRVGNFFRLLYI